MRAAHLDDQHAVRGQIRNAERDIEHSTRRIAEIGQDIARRISTAGDAFALTMNGESFTERKLAGRALMKEIMTLVHLREEGEQPIATIGGFDLVFAGERFGRDDFRYEVIFARTCIDTEIDLALTLTPLGAIARIEHVLSGFEEERAQHRFRLDDANRRLASYRSRSVGAFGFEEELADKRHQLEDIEKRLSEEAMTPGSATGIAA